MARLGCFVSNPVVSPSIAEITEANKLLFSTAGQDISPVPIPGNVELELESLSSSISPDKEWDVRVEAMKRFMGLVNSGILHDDFFRRHLLCFHPGLTSAITNLRSALVKQACLVVSQLARELGPLFEGIGDYFIPLSSQLSHGTQIISESCFFSIVTIVKNCQSKKILLSIFDLANNKQKKAPQRRTTAAVCLETAVRMWDFALFDANWGNFEVVILSLLNDANSETRDHARNVIRAMKGISPKRAESIIQQLDERSKKAIEDTSNYEIDSTNDNDNIKNNINYDSPKKALNKNRNLNSELKLNKNKGKISGNLNSSNGSTASSSSVQNKPQPQMKITRPVSEKERKEKKNTILKPVKSIPQIRTKAMKCLKNEILPEIDFDYGLSFDDNQTNEKFPISEPSKIETNNLKTDSQTESIEDKYMNIGGVKRNILRPISSPKAKIDSEIDSKNENDEDIKTKENCQRNNISGGGSASSSCRSQLPKFQKKIQNKIAENPISAPQPPHTSSSPRNNNNFGFIRNNNSSNNNNNKNNVNDNNDNKMNSARSNSVKDNNFNFKKKKEYIFDNNDKNNDNDNESVISIGTTASVNAVENSCKNNRPFVSKISENKPKPPMAMSNFSDQKQKQTERCHLYDHPLPPAPAQQSQQKPQKKKQDKEGGNSNKSKISKSYDLIDGEEIIFLENVKDLLTPEIKKSTKQDELQSNLPKIAAGTLKCITSASVSSDDSKKIVSLSLSILKELIEQFPNVFQKSLPKVVPLILTFTDNEDATSILLFLSLNFTEDLLQIALFQRNMLKGNSQLLFLTYSIIKSSSFEKSLSSPNSDLVIDNDVCLGLFDIAFGCRRINEQQSRYIIKKLLIDNKNPNLSFMAAKSFCESLSHNERKEFELIINSKAPFEIFDNNSKSENNQIDERNNNKIIIPKYSNNNFKKIVMEIVPNKVLWDEHKREIFNQISSSLKKASSPKKDIFKLIKSIIVNNGIEEDFFIPVMSELINTEGSDSTIDFVLDKSPSFDCFLNLLKPSLSLILEAQNIEGKAEYLNRSFVFLSKAIFEKFSGKNDSNINESFTNAMPYVLKAVDSADVTVRQSGIQCFVQLKIAIFDKADIFINKLNEQQKKLVSIYYNRVK